MWFNWAEDKFLDVNMANANEGGAAQVVAGPSRLGRSPEWTEESWEDFLFLFENYVELNEVPDRKNGGW